MKKILIALFLVVGLFTVACNAQGTTFLRGRCPAPNSNTFQYFQLQSDGNQQATTCAGGGFYVNGTLLPTGTGTANRITYWSGTNTLGSTSAVFQSSPANVLSAASGTLNIGGGDATYAYALGNSLSYQFGVNGTTSSWNAAAVSSSNSSYRAGMNASGGASPFTTIFAGGTGISGTSSVTTDLMLWRQYASSGAEFRMEADWRLASGRWRVGDYTTTPTNYLDLNQTANRFTVVAQTDVRFFDPATQLSYASFAAGGLYSFSDAAAANFVNFDVVNKTFNLSFASGGAATYAVPTGQVQFGDPAAAGNSTTLTVADSTSTITLAAPNSNIVFANSFTPAASTDACTAGKISWDASFIYVCTASGAWKRATLAAF